ncbi:MAG: hypothetical protein AAGM22_09355 [Acidobacteriota bacterium]
MGYDTRLLKALLAMTLALLTLAPLLSTPAAALDFRFETENDFLTGDNEDDLYTFAVALEFDRGEYLWAIREKAFTDRDGGVRFDETQIAVGRQVTLPGGWFRGWDAYGEIGVIRLGEGLLGEDVQNALHSVIGSDEVDLDYVAEDDVHASLFLRLDRLYKLRHNLTAGPRIEAFSAPGFRNTAVASVQAFWQPTDYLAVEALAGARFSESSLRFLDPHLEEVDAVAELGFVLQDRILVSWSYNDHGTAREHFSIGYRFGNFKGEKDRRGAID